VALRDRYEARVRRLVERGMTERVFRRTDAKLAALCVLGAVNWTVKWYGPGGRGTLEDIGRRFAENLVRGLLAPGRRFTPASDEILEVVCMEEEHDGASDRHVRRQW